MRSTQGFTLIETLLYIGLLAFLTSGSLMAAYVVMGTSARSLTGARITEEGMYLSKKIERNFLLGEPYDIEFADGDIMQDGEILNGSDISVTHFVRETCNASGRCARISFVLTSTTTNGQALSRAFEVVHTGQSIP